MMFTNILTFGFSLICISCVLAAKLPSNFKKCSIKDTNCLKDAIQDALPKLKEGIPELGVPPLDPLAISNMTIEAGESVVQLQQKYTNAAYNGMSDAKIEKLVFNIEEGKIAFEFSAPFLELNGTYDFNGKILVLPLYGKGACSLRLEGVTGIVKFEVETYTKDNEKYIRGKHSKMDFDIKRGIYLFDNLFDGNKQLADNIMMIINENWRPIFNEVISEYRRVYGNGLMDLMNKLFEKIPISEAFSK